MITVGWNFWNFLEISAALQHKRMKRLLVASYTQKVQLLEISTALQPAELQKIVRLTQQLPESTGKHDASFLDFLPVMRR